MIVIKRSHLVLALAAAITIIFSSGVALAFWTAGGTGSGTAAATTAIALTTSTATPTAQLYPGGTGDAKVTINNTNSYAVTVTDIVGGTITGSSGVGTCTTTGVTFTNQHLLTSVVGAHGSATLTLAGAVSMSNASDDGCQGAVFTIPVTITGHS
jgi:hypothetical protein